MGKAMFTIIGAMAELERNVIRERVIAGLEYARQHGTKSGKAVGRPKRIVDRAEVRLRESGLSIEKIARQMGIGVGTVARVIHAHESRTTTFPKPFVVAPTRNSPSKSTSGGSRARSKTTTFWHGSGAAALKVAFSDAICHN